MEFLTLNSNLKIYKKINEKEDPHPLHAHTYICFVWVGKSGSMVEHFIIRSEALGLVLLSVHIHEYVYEIH